MTISDDACEEQQKPLRQVVEERLQKEVGIRAVGDPFEDRVVEVPDDLYELLVQMSFSNPIYMVEEFHRVYGLHVHNEVMVGKYDHEFRHGMNYSQLGRLRYKLLDEEFNDEYADADSADDKQGMIDALCDIIYVAVGAALELGLPIRLGLNEVHRSNMSKLGADGKPIYREDGKILKGPDYTPPNWVEVFQEWEAEKGKV